MLIDLQTDYEKIEKLIKFAEKRKLDDDMQIEDLQNYANKKIKFYTEVLNNKMNIFEKYKKDGIGLYDYYLSYYAIKKHAICKSSVRFPDMYSFFDDNWKPSYGYADSLEQVLELYNDVLQSEEHNYIICYKIVDHPTEQDVYKGGKYIGKKENPLEQVSICKYLIYEIIL